MKVSLILPPCPYQVLFPPGVHPRFFPPLGIGYIASMLEKDGHEVSIADLYLKPWALIKEVFQGRRFDVVGISCLFPSRSGVFGLLRFLENRYPDTKVILGGPYASVMAERLAALSSVTAVVVGEGEYTMPELINAIEKGNSFHGIKGLVFREGDHIIRTPSREYIQDLDQIPFPAFHLYDRKSYHCFLPGNFNVVSQFFRDKIAGRRWAPILTTRSCEYHCQFCAVNITTGDKPRSRSAQNIIDEFAFLKDRFGYENIFFQDAAFPVGSKLSNELCRLFVERRLGMRWATNARADTVTLEALKLLKAAGCSYLLYGLESGSRKIFSKINKRETMEQISEAVMLTKRAGIDVGVHILVGYPGEDEQTIKETIAYVKKLKNFISTLYVRPLAVFPGTELYRDILAKGLMDENDFFRPSGPFFINYTIEHPMQTLLRWKTQIQAVTKPLYFFKCFYDLIQNLIRKLIRFYK